MHIMILFEQQRITLLDESFTATQAPQPMQVAASNASSASFSNRIELASIVFPEVFTDINPPACWILSNALRFTTKSFNTGNERLDCDRVAILNIRM
jgi:hypothetical protein